MAPLELGSELARESFPELGGGYSDHPVCDRVCDRGISALSRLDSKDKTAYVRGHKGR